MKTTILILAAFVLLGISGCNSNDKKITDVKKDTSSTKETKTITKKDTAYDADPTDTIPGNRYGINSSSKQTADLVRMTLKNKFKSDLEKNLIDSLSRKFIFFITWPPSGKISSYLSIRGIFEILHQYFITIIKLWNSPLCK